MVVTFGVFFFYAIGKGRYALVNVILALYLALLVSIKFPYYEMLASGGGQSAAIAKIIIFIVFVLIGIFLFRRHIPGDDYEPAFQSFWKKILLSVMATILVMIFSFHALPVTEIITPGSPIQALFASEQNFFWWLVLPLIVLFFV
jgi:hydrogenase-4 membrane subunit HyfE